MSDPLNQLAEALGCILARTLHRESMQQEAMQKQFDELDAVAARTQHPPDCEGGEHAGGDIRAIQQRLAEPEVCG